MKLQVLVVLVITGCLPMFLFVSTMTTTYRNQTVDNKVDDLIYRANLLANSIVSKRFLVEPDSEVVKSELAQVADVYNGRIVVVNNKYKVVYDSFTNGLVGNYNISEDIIVTMKGTKAYSIKEEDQYVQLTYPIVVTNEENSRTMEDTTNSTSSNDNSTTIIGTIVVSTSLSEANSLVATVGSKALKFMLVIMVLVLVFAAWYAYQLSAPFQRITNTIDHMAEGDFDEKLSVEGFAEVQRMSDSFNKMINRIQQLESSRQEFVSNVSHELKTPITSIKVLADSLLTQDDVPAELYREFLVDINEEIERENKIINDLLSLVKLDKTAGEMHIQNISINDLLEQILKRLRPIAGKRNIELIFESFRPVEAEVDEVKLSLAISNLIENAIKYNYEDGWVRVSLNADHKFFYIKVMDSGVGIPEDVQDHIFERFYRVDKARSRETGGTGLGLSIARNAILMHRGAIKVASKEKEGTTFTVRVPLIYIA